MVNRPYSCPLCHSAFRNESGMKWHLAHKHEIPAALDALGKKYDEKLSALEKENSQLKKRVEQLTWELERNLTELLEAKKAKLELYARISELDASLQQAIFIIATRDSFIKDKLNIDMPLPHFK
jgi:DNA repair exonuclease SbcCD ATPase subunit